jgi:predicted GIY-YIG superfamily endonuclease/flagellar motor protein MotB
MHKGSCCGNHCRRTFHANRERIGLVTVCHPIENIQIEVDLVNPYGSTIEEKANVPWIDEIPNRNRDSINQNLWSEEAMVCIINKQPLPYPIQTDISLEKNNKNNEEKIILYSLKLNSNKYYIGITSNFTKRLEQHKNNQGSVWTAKYGVFSVLSQEKIEKNLSKLEETKLTCKMMLEYGHNNVRGAEFCQLRDYSIEEVVGTIGHHLDIKYNQVRNSLKTLNNSNILQEQEQANKIEQEQLLKEYEAKQKQVKQEQEQEQTKQEQEQKQEQTKQEQEQEQLLKFKNQTELIIFDDDFTIEDFHKLILKFRTSYNKTQKIKKIEEKISKGLEFKCSICKYTSSYKVDLQKHFNKKNKCGQGIPKIIEIPVDIKCEFCNNFFSNRSNMKRHSKTCKAKKYNLETELIKKIKELEDKLTQKSTTIIINDNSTNNNSRIIKKILG